VAVFEGYYSAYDSAKQYQCCYQYHEPGAFEIEHVPDPKVAECQREEKAKDTKEYISYGVFGVLLFFAYVDVVCHVSLL